jgi:hypothetical protein
MKAATHKHGRRVLPHENRTQYYDDGRAPALDRIAFWIGFAYGRIERALGRTR